ncbi:HBL/NHE enterotoxin family protein [Spirosoma arcticum]
MSQTLTSFRTASLKRAVGDAAVSAVQIDLYATAVTAQSTFNIDGLPELDTHLTNAQKHANYWTGTLTQELKNSFADVIGFGQTFTTYYDQLSVQAGRMATDPDARTTFLDGMKDLKNQIQARLYGHANANVTYVGIYGLLADLKDFQNNLNTDYAAFQADNNRLAALIQASPDVQAQLDQLAIDRRTAVAKITVDCVVIGAGVALIIIGAVATIPTAGVGAGLIVTGATLVLGGAGGVVADGVGLADIDKQYGVLIKKLAEQNDRKAALAHTQTIITDFVTKAGDAQEAISNVIAGWEAISDDIDQVITALNEAKDDVRGGLYSQIQSDLDNARDEWNELITFATDLQTRTKLNVTSSTPA